MYTSGVGMLHFNESLKFVCTIFVNCMSPYCLFVIHCCPEAVYKECYSCCRSRWPPGWSTWWLAPRWSQAWVQTKHSAGQTCKICTISRIISYPKDGNTWASIFNFITLKSNKHLSDTRVCFAFLFRQLRQRRLEATLRLMMIRMT